MTEAEWLSSTEPKAMLDWLMERRSGKASDRRLRLFACATARIVENHDTHKEWVDVVEACELFADGKPSKFGSDGLGLLAAAKSIDSVYGWLWAATRLTISGAINETLRVVAGLAGKFNDGRAADALREIFGNPFRSVELPREMIICPTCRGQGHVREDGPYSSRWNRVECGRCEASGKVVGPCPWLMPIVLSIAQAIYQDRTYGDMGVLADALEEAGCDHDDVLKHCRGFIRCYHCLDWPESERGDWCTYCGHERWLPEWWGRTPSPSPPLHVHGCWLLSLLLGLE